jgi:hypothetical protein
VVQGAAFVGGEAEAAVAGLDALEAEGARVDGERVGARDVGVGAERGGDPADGERAARAG